MKILTYIVNILAAVLFALLVAGASLFLLQDTVVAAKQRWSARKPSNLRVMKAGGSYVS